MTNEDKKRGQAQKAEKRAAALRENLLRRKAAGNRADTDKNDKNKEPEDHDERRDQ